MYAATNYEGARMFDTLAFAKELEAGGFDRCQAEALAAAQHRALLNALTISELATKTDLAEQKAELKQELVGIRQEMAEQKAELKQDIAELGATLRHEMSEMKISIIKWMVGIMLGQSALIIAVMALLHR